MLLIALALVGFAIFNKKSSDKSELTPIRVGWQVAWVPQGQLVGVMKNTDVLKLNGLAGEFKKFSFGGPLTEAALANEVDVIFVGSGPALSLTAKSDDWKIVSRLEDYRNAIIVPQNSNIKGISDLKGKVVASPFGSTSYILGTIALQKAGFDLNKDVSLRNVDVLEQANIIQKGTPESWGEISAFTSWDPTPAQFEELGKARVLVLLPDVGVVVMSKKFYEEHPTEAKNFLKALVQSYDFYYKNKDVADEWYLKDALVNFSKKVLETSSALERNNKAKNVKEITLILEEADIARIQEEANHAFILKILKKQLTLNEITDQAFIKLAEDEIEKGNFSKTIKVTQ